MLDKARGQHLHNRSTSGDTLTNAEQVKLNAWYAQQDAEESKSLTATDALQRAHSRQQISQAMLSSAVEFEEMTKEEEAALMEDIRQGEADFAAGRYITLDELKIKYAALLGENVN